VIERYHDGLVPILSHHTAVPLRAKYAPGYLNGQVFLQAAPMETDAQTHVSFRVRNVRFRLAKRKNLYMKNGK
jgi:hypothetical protein